MKLLGYRINLKKNWCVKVIDFLIKVNIIKIDFMDKF